MKRLTVLVMVVLCAMLVPSTPVPPSTPTMIDTMLAGTDPQSCVPSDDGVRFAADSTCDRDDGNELAGFLSVLNENGQDENAAYTSGTTVCALGCCISLLCPGDAAVMDELDALRAQTGNATDIGFIDVISADADGTSEEVAQRLEALNQQLDAIEATLTDPNNRPQDVLNLLDAAVAGVVPVVTKDDTAPIMAVSSLSGDAGRQDILALFADPADTTQLASIQVLLDQTPSSDAATPADSTAFEDALRQKGRLRQGLPPLSHDAPVVSATFSADGQLIAVGTEDGAVSLWNRNGDRLFSVDVYANGPTAMVSLSDNGEMLLTVSQGDIRVWDTQPPAERIGITRPVDTRTLVIDPNMALGAAGGGFGFAIFDLEIGRIIAEHGGIAVNALAFDPSGQLLAVGTDNGFQLYVMDDPGVPVYAVTGIGAVHSVAFGRASDVLVIGGDSAAVYAVFGEPARLLNIATVPDSSVIRQVIVSADGTTLTLVGEQVDAEGTFVGGAIGVFAVPRPACVLTAPAITTVNLRTGPGIQFDLAGQLAAGRRVGANGQNTDAEGVVWYRTTQGSWASSSIITVGTDCDGLPTVE